MKYIKVLFITSITFGIYNLGAQETIQRDVPSQTQQTLVNISEIKEQESDTQKSTAETQEKNAVDEWKQFIQTPLSDDDWDSVQNTPMQTWRTKAFNLAENAVKSDISLKETVTEDFVKAINSKATGISIQNATLIAEFKTMIDGITPSQSSEQKDVSNPPAAIIIMPEAQTSPAQEQPITEPPLPVIPAPEEFPTISPHTPSPAQTPEQPPQKDPYHNWKEKLQKLTTAQSLELDILRQEIYDAAKILQSEMKIDRLQAELQGALEDRRALARTKKTIPLDIQSELDKFNAALGIAFPQDNFSYNQFNEWYGADYNQPTIDPEEKKALEKQLAEQDAQLKKQKEEQRKREEKFKQTERILQASILKSQEKGDSNEEKVKSLEYQLKVLNQKIKEKEQKDKVKEIKLKEDIATTTEKMAKIKKAEEEKGWLQAGKDWLLGSNNQKILAQLQEEQKKLFDQLGTLGHINDTQKESLKKFYDLVAEFNKAEFWDVHHSKRMNAWINVLQRLITKIVFDHKLLLPNEVSSILRKTLNAYDKTTPQNVTHIINTIMHPIIEREKSEIAQQQAIEVALQQKKERKKAKEEQILLAQQKKIEELQNKQTKEKESLNAAQIYKNEKKDWYALLDRISHISHANEQKEYLKNALEKSQSILKLAHSIPHKNSAKVAQKLKQKFAVALLDQQKRDPINPSNIHTTMDWFNNEINKIEE